MPWKRRVITMILFSLFSMSIYLCSQERIEYIIAKQLFLSWKTIPSVFSIVNVRCRMFNGDIIDLSMKILIELDIYILYKTIWRECCKIFRYQYARRCMATRWFSHHNWRNITEFVNRTDGLEIMLRFDDQHVFQMYHYWIYGGISKILFTPLLISNWWHFEQFL